MSRFEDVRPDAPADGAPADRRLADVRPRGLLPSLSFADSRCCRMWKELFWMASMNSAPYTSICRSTSSTRPPKRTCA